MSKRHQITREHAAKWSTKPKAPASWREEDQQDAAEWIDRKSRKASRRENMARDKTKHFRD